MSYSRGVFGMTRWEGESNESVDKMWQEIFCKWSELWSSGKGENKYFVVVCHLEINKSEEFVKKVYANEIESQEERKASCKN